MKIRAFLALLLITIIPLFTGCDWTAGGGADDFSADPAFSNANFTGSYVNTAGATVVPCADVFLLQVEHIGNRLIIRTDRGSTLEGSIGPIGGTDGDFDGTSGDVVATFNVSGEVSSGLTLQLIGSFRGTVAGQTVTGRNMIGSAVRSDGVSCPFAGAAN